MTKPSTVQVLAARLRLTLDQRLGRDTPEWVREMAGLTIRGEEDGRRRQQ